MFTFAGTPGTGTDKFTLAGPGCPGIWGAILTLTAGPGCPGIGIFTFGGVCAKTLTAGTRLIINRLFFIIIKYFRLYLY
jgi:hypothetical protein